MYPSQIKVEISIRGGIPKLIGSPNQELEDKCSDNTFGEFSPEEEDVLISGAEFISIRGINYRVMPPITASTSRDSGPVKTAIYQRVKEHPFKD